MPNPSDWHIEDVKSAIRKTGQTLTGLSIQFGYERSAVRVALRHPWPKVEQIIARHLRVQPWDIWPSRYDDQFQPLKGLAGRRRRPDPSTGGTTFTHRKTGAGR